MASITSSGKGILVQGIGVASFPSTSIFDDSSSSEVTALHFVVATGKERPDPEMRKLIRSHVMIGKNRGRTLPLRKPSKRKRVQDTSLGPNRPFSDMVPHPVLPLTIPHNFGTELSTIPFPGSVEPLTVDVVLQFSSIAKKVLFPLESCIFFEDRVKTWIAPLATDPVFLHMMIFTSQYYFDAIQPHRFSFINQRSFPHYLETLRLLRDRLAHEDDQVRLSNSTAIVVMGIAGHAHVMGDSKSTKHHLRGLSRIIALRGGVASFKRNTKLLLEILRCDLGMELHTGSGPVFFSSEQEDFLPYPDLTSLLKLRNVESLSSQDNSAHLFDDINGELARAWKVTSDFCTLINFAAESKQLISTDNFLDAMASVMYRLLRLRFKIGSLDELIRLSLLAFSSNIFLHWKHIGMPYQHLTFTFKNRIQNLRSSHISSQLLLWILMTGAISVFDAVDDLWLKPLLAAHISLCKIDSWSEMQDLLKSFMWISMIHDKAGKVVFDKVWMGS